MLYANEVSFSCTQNLPDAENGAECAPPQNAPAEVLNPAVVNPNLSLLQRPFYCDIHHHGQRLFCQTCCTPICAECGFQLHQNHATIDFKKVIEETCVQANQVLKDAKLGVSVLTDELDHVQVSYPLRNSFIADIIKYDNDSLHRECLILLCRYLLEKLSTAN